MTDGRWRLVLTVFIGVLIILTGFGCSKKPQQKLQLQQKQLVGVSLADMSSAGAKTIKKALDKSKGKQVKFIYKDAKNDVAQQSMHVDELLEQKIKVLLIEFISPTEAVRLAEKAKAKGIKVLALNILPANVPVDGYIGPDYTRVGQLQGQYILNQKDKLKSPSGLTLIAKGSPRAVPIVTGQKQVLGDKVAVTTREISGENPTLIRSEVAKAVLEAGKMGAVTAASETITKALLENAVDPTLITIGTGITKESAQAMLMGVHDADVDLMPDLVGSHAARAVSELLKSEAWNAETIIANGNYDIPATIVPVRLITRENLFLVKQRLGDIKAQPPQKGSSGESQGQKQSQSSSSSENPGGSQGQKGSGGTKLIIETTDGKKMELQIDGEIKSVQVEKGGQGRQGQGQQQGGQQQGGGGQSGMGGA